MGVRLEPADEYMHELGPEPNFNESMYVNCFDPDQQVGGWFRMGNRANEGNAELTVCLYLPGGRVAFMFKRPSITTNDALDAGGMTWTMVTPFEEMRVDYGGRVVVLDEPTQMANPRQAFADNPHVPCEVHLTFTGQGRASMFGGEPDTPHETTGEEFAKGHYEQLVAGRGTIVVGDEAWAITGHGLRDHSWGPRYWQAPFYYRWLTANVSADFGFATISSSTSYYQDKGSDVSDGSPFIVVASCTSAPIARPVRPRISSATSGFTDRTRCWPRSSRNQTSQRQSTGASWICNFGGTPAAPPAWKQEKNTGEAAGAHDSVHALNYAAMKPTLALIVLIATSVFAADTPDLTMQNRIRQEGFRNS